MLLKSSSNPALNSWFQQQNPKPSSPDHVDLIHRNIKSQSRSLHSSNSLISRTSSENDLTNLSYVKRKNNCVKCLVSYVEDVEEVEEIENMGLWFSTSGLDVNEGCRLQFTTDGTSGGGGFGGGNICGGGGGGNGDCDNGSDSTDVYYKNMIEANPGNSLILTNYAKYLKEVYISYYIIKYLVLSFIAYLYFNKVYVKFVV